MKLTEQELRAILQQQGSRSGRRNAECLTADQFAIHQAYITRVLSGHWVFFFWMGILASHSHLIEGAKKRAARQVATAVSMD